MEPSPLQVHTDGGRPRRRSGTSRAVAGLNEEERRHKREIDRRAQRALRQRAKDSMLNLEQQFARMQERCAQQEEELDFLRRHNQELRRCQYAIRDALANSPGPIPGPRAMTENVPDVGNGGGRTLVTTNETPPSPDIGQPEHDAHSTSAVDPMSCSSATPESGTNSGPPGTAHSYQPLALSTSRLLHGTGHGAHVQTRTPVMHNPHPDTSLPVVDRDLSPIISSSSPLMNCSYNSGLPTGLPTPCSGIVSGQWQRVSPKSAFNALPTHLPPSCPLDQILLDFIESRKAGFVGDLGSEASIWPQKPKVQALIDDSLVQTVDSLSSIISRVLSTFQHVKLPEKLAFFYLEYHVSKWLIQPTKENYLAMPVWLRPTVTQVTVTHEIWIDTIPWPGVRDILIENSDQFPFELFSEFYSHNVTVNWQFDEMDAVSNDSNNTILHSIFEKHVQKLSNWTVSAEFKSRFPEMVPAVYPS